MANSGWTNDAVDTLTVPTGATSGRRVVIANQATGDAVDVYDALNNLIYAITGLGAAVSFHPSDNRRVTIFDGAVQLLGANGFVDMFYVEPSPFTPSSQPELFIEVFGPSSSYTLILEAQSSDGTMQPTAIGSERNIQGSIVQADSVGFGAGFGNLVHMGVYSGTTDAAGHLVFNHGCLFTPAGAIITGRAPAVGTFPNLTFGTDGFTSTLANVSFIVANTGAAYANSPVMFQAIFFG